MNLNIALFGESEKGSFHHLIPIDSITKLPDALGHPPDESIGIGLAVQILLFRNQLIYKRVDEEGFNDQEYYRGLNLLKGFDERIDGIYMPGVGSQEIIEAAEKICKQKQAMLLINEKDFYDFLTS